MNQKTNVEVSVTNTTVRNKFLNVYVIKKYEKESSISTNVLSIEKKSCKN